MLCIAAYGAVPRTISFQGRLTNLSGVPTPGEFPMTFRLWDDSTGGNALLVGVLPSVQVDDDGLYSVEVAVPDSVAFDNQLWLGVEIESNGEMTPRYKLTASPHAFWAMNSSQIQGNTVADLDTRYLNEGQPDAVTTGMIKSGEIVNSDLCDTAKIAPSKILGTAWTALNDGALSGLSADSLDGRKAGNLSENIPMSNGILCANLNADMLDGTGSEGFIAGGGTMNSVPQFTSPNRLGDSPIFVTADTVLLTGGMRVTDKASIGPGCTNAGVNSFAVGYNCAASGSYAVVAGGHSNTAGGTFACIAGGDSNAAGNTRAFVGGGHRNAATATSTSIAGGYRNIASDTFATVGGGYTNEATRRGSTVGGGYGNHASERFATVAGGNDNRAGGNTATVAGGYWNTASGSYSFVGGGYTNSVKGSYSAIICGIADTIITGADYSCLFGIKSRLTQDSTFMVDMPHIRFGNETHGYEFPASDGSAGQSLVTDGSGHLSWQNPALPSVSANEMRVLVSTLKAQQAEIDSLRIEMRRMKLGR